MAGGLAARNYEGRGARGKGPHAVRGPRGGGGAASARPSKKERRAWGPRGRRGPQRRRASRNRSVSSGRRAGMQADKRGVQACQQESRHIRA